MSLDDQINKRRLLINGIPTFLWRVKAIHPRYKVGVGWINRRKTVKQVRRFHQGSPTVPHFTGNGIIHSNCPWFFVGEMILPRKGGVFAASDFIPRIRRHHQPVRLDVHPTCHFAIGIVSHLLPCQHRLLAGCQGSKLDCE